MQTSTRSLQWRGIGAALAVSALVAVSPPPATAAAGSLDAIFGTGGITQWSPTVGNELVFAVTHQPDGKIVSVGLAKTSEDVLLSRHNPDGTLDTTFGGGDGVVITDIAARDQATALALQPDGRIVVAGCDAVLCFGGDHLLLRYDADGNIDNTFGGGDGTVRLDLFSNSDGAYAVAIDTDGRILTAGFAKPVANAPFDFAVVAFNAGGTLDTTFGGGDGIITTDFGAGDQARSIAVQTDGRLVVAGVSNGNFAVARYHPNGSLDLSFSGDGKLTTDFGGSDEVRDVAIDANDRIVVAGRGYNGVLAVARYTTGGPLDTTFSGDGKVIAPNYTVVINTHQDIGVEIQVDGKPVVGGVVEGSLQSDFGVARFTVAGTLDTTFSGDGVAKVDIAADDDWGYDVSLDAAGDVVVAGGTDGLTGGEHDGSAVLMRFLAGLAASACPGMTITNVVTGTPGDDNLVGTSGSDFIYGRGGNDTIIGGDGDDCIYGGTGDDVIDGSAGSDRMFAESGNDILIGGEGLDKVVGGPGNDVIRIAAGDVPAASTETLKGKAGSDTVELGAGVTTGEVTGVAPTFTVTDPTTGGTYSAVKVEVIADT